MHASEEELQESVEDIVSREVRKATNRLEEKLDTLLLKLDENGKWNVFERKQSLQLTILQFNLVNYFQNPLERIFSIRQTSDWSW